MYTMKMESVHGYITVAFHYSRLVYIVKGMVPLFNWNIQRTNNHGVNTDVADVKSLGNNTIVAT